MTQSSSFLTVAKAIAFASGILIVILGGLAGLTFLWQALLSPSTIVVDNTVISASAVVLAMGLGGALAWQSIGALRRQASRLFHPRSVLVFILIYIPTVTVGQLLISFDLYPVLTFPVFHIAAASLPPLAVLAFTGRSFRSINLRWREVIVQLSGGAFLSTTIAFIAEIIIGILLLFTAFLITALIPGGSVLIEELTTNLQNPLWLQNPDNVQEILFLPPVFITLALIFVVVAPLIEEFAKLVGVTLMSYRRPLQTQIFVWGLASGAGFALAENFFNTVLALDAWALVMLLRIGGTAMHCVGAGLTALGWHSFLKKRGIWQLLGLYTLSVTIHATWNGAVVGMAGMSVFLIDSTGEVTEALIGGIILTFLILLVVLTIALIITLVILTRRLKDTQSPSPTANHLTP